MLSLIVCVVRGQDSIQLTIVIDGQTNEQNWADSLQIDSLVDSKVEELLVNHYLEAAIDSIVVASDSSLLAFIHQGRQYQDIFITPNEAAIEFAQGKLRSMAYRYKNALKLKSTLLKNAENNGYPFAEIVFKNIEVTDDKVKAEMHLILNRKILVNQIKIIGDATISPGFLGPYLGLVPGKVFSKKQLEQAKSRLNNLPFINTDKSPNVLFNDQGADIYIFANNREASRFDALVGVLPLNDPLLDNNVIVTATAMIDLINTLNRGERIFFEFRQLKPLTQNVKAEFRYPYFFGLPFGLRSSFELAKQDTSFLDIDYTIGAQYLYGGDNYVEIFYASDITRILDVNENSVINSRLLPKSLDTRTQYYGIQWQYHNLKNLNNPRQGWLLKNKFMLGVKQIRPNSLILDLSDPMDEDFDFRTLYDEFEKEDQFILAVDIARYQSIGRQSSIKIGLNAAGIIGKSEIFTNEQFRIGGNQLLRGFNEQNFFTDRYLVNTLEYRFTLTGNSVLFAFSDLALLQVDKSADVYNYPWGLGAGINFETAAGILSLSAAVGRDLSNQEDFFDLGKPKIHIGYVNLF